VQWTLIEKCEKLSEVLKFMSFPKIDSAVTGRNPQMPVITMTVDFQ